MGTMDGQRPPALTYRAQANPPPKDSKLSTKEVAAIREKARNQVELELKDREEADLLERFKQEERRRHDPKLEEQPIFLDLAPSQPWIMLDGTQYLDGHLYYVTPPVFAVLLEQMNRGWAHEELTQVRSDSGYARRPAHVGTGNFLGNRTPRDMRISAGAMAGTVGAMQGMLNP